MQTVDTLTPFTSQEHSLFLEALERYGEGNMGGEWELIARAVGTRIPQEVMLHAHQYFLRLQNMAQGDPAAGEAAMAAIDDGSWTFEEETVFENGMATFDEDDVERWAKIASLLREKTPDDVRRRYQKLMYDVTQIESGQQVTVHYKVKQRLGAAAGGAGGVPPAPGSRGKMNGTAAAAALAAVVAEAMNEGGEGGGGGGAEGDGADDAAAASMLQ